MIVTLSFEVIPEERFALSARFSVPPGLRRLLQTAEANALICPLVTVRKRGAFFFKITSAWLRFTGVAVGAGGSVGATSLGPEEFEVGLALAVSVTVTTWLGFEAASFPAQPATAISPQRTVTSPQIRSEGPMSAPYRD